MQDKIKNFLKMYGAYEMPVDVKRLAEKIGFRVIKMDAGTKNDVTIQENLNYNFSPKSTIFVYADDSRWETKMQYASGIAKYILFQEELKLQNIKGKSMVTIPLEMDKAELSKVIMEVLLPTELVKKEVVNSELPRNPSKVQIQNLAESFGVTSKLMSEKFQQFTHKNPSTKLDAYMEL